jgi:hypothetical protein
MTPTIYKIEFPDGKCYIGSSCNFHARKGAHLRDMRKGKAVNRKLQEHFDKYKACRVYPIASGFDREALHHLERDVIGQEKPDLNTHLVPNRLPTLEETSAKPFGPYKSMKVAAAVLGVSYTHLKRKAKTQTYEEVLAYTEAVRKTVRVVECTHPLDPRKNNRLFVHNGAWCDSKQLREVNKVQEKTYRKRIAAGWSRYDACTIPKGKKSRKRLELFGGITYACYLGRKYAGYPDRQCRGIEPLQLKEPNVQRRSITAGGKTMTVQQWASGLGVKPATVHSRLFLGWSEEEAVGLVQRPKKTATADSKKLRKKRAIHTVHGVTGNASELARYFGVPLSGVYFKLNRGDALEDIFITRLTC